MSNLWDIQRDVLLCYIVEADGRLSLDKDAFLPSAAYIQDGKIQDFMYDSFIFLPQPDYLYDGDKRPLNKKNWLDYLDGEEFAPGLNVDALNAAVGEAKDALGNHDYRAEIYLSLFYPVTAVTDFGEVNGRQLNFSRLEDRKAALHWIVDEAIARFCERHYEHLRLGGFYWFTEDLDKEIGDLEMLRDITDYIREQGCMTCWCPYFWAHGYDRWRELGFDFAAHQANYFPETHKHWPNRGTAERLPLAAEAAKKYKIGVGMEMANTWPTSVAVIKEYFEAGATLGFMQAPHIYYMGVGPNNIRILCESDDAYIRSAYDELYRFIHKTLDPASIVKKMPQTGE